MLQQVLVNLLLNSLHASEEGQTVTARLERREKRAAIVIQDQGSGIPSELKPRVFKPYVSGRPEGHGLGLAVVKQVAGHHGWTVDIDSRPSGGTRVVITNIEVARRGEGRS
jgi:signal transduction histidine kinase